MSSPTSNNRLGFGALVGLLLLGTAACGGEQATASGSALDLSGLRPQPPLQRLRVVARVDDHYRQTPHFQRRVGDRLDAVADHMAVRFGIALDVVRIEDWAAAPMTMDAEGLLASLENSGQTFGPKGQTQDADLVIGFTARPPPRRPVMADLARSRYLGRFLVVRSLTTLFSPDQPEALHQAEVLTLLHGLGTIFGAVPTCGDTVMADRPRLVSASGDEPLGSGGWGQTNLALVRAHASLDLTAHTGRLPHAIARRAKELLDAAPEDLKRCAGDRIERRRELLTQVIEAEPDTPALPRPASEPDPPEVLRGFAALEAGRAQEALDLCAPLANELPAGRAPRCAGLAAQKLGRPHDAIRFLRAYLTHHPGQAEVVIHLARLLGRSGDDAAARALLTGFLAAHPEDSEARINLGIASARMGDYDGAREAWRKVLAAEPQNQDAKELLEQLPARSPLGDP